MSDRSNIQQRQGSRGSALIIILWVIGLLSMLVASMTFDAHIEARITSYYRKRMKAEYLARSGLAVAEMLMAKSDELRGDDGDSGDEDDRWHKHAQGLADGADITGLVEPLGDGTITLSIVPEPARRNVNKLTEDDWERIFEVAGVPVDMWPELIDAFFDWKDSEEPEDTRPDGAESDYYEDLDPPYKAKNGPLDTVGELLLIKGFAKTILEGGILGGDESDDGVSIMGIGDMLTTYGDGKVNVNSAVPRVLMTLPDIDELVAGAIIEEREGWVNNEGEVEDTPFESEDDFFSRIPGLSPSLRKYVTTDSDYYRVTSVGTVGGVSREVWAVVRYSRASLTILRWREQD